MTAAAVETTTTDGEPSLRISRRRATLRGWSRASLVPVAHGREIDALAETHSGGNQRLTNSDISPLRQCKYAFNCIAHWCLTVDDMQLVLSSLKEM